MVRKPVDDEMSCYFDDQQLNHRRDLFDQLLIVTLLVYGNEYQGSVVVAVIADEEVVAVVVDDVINLLMRVRVANGHYLEWNSKEN